jgi:hypothetical protein
MLSTNLLSINNFSTFLVQCCKTIFHCPNGLATTIGEKASAKQWHSQLGHPSQAIFSNFNV